MSSKKKNGRKERFKPLSFYGYDPRDAIRTFMPTDPEELQRLEAEERLQWVKNLEDID